MDARAEKIALFRHALIAPLLLEILPRGELTRRAEEIAARKYEIPYSERTSLSVDTLLDWVLRYRRGGFPALAPKQRCDRGQSRVVPQQLAELIEQNARTHIAPAWLCCENWRLCQAPTLQASRPRLCIASSNNAA